MSLLKNIHSPADLKRLSPEQFPELCQEIREQILAVVSNVGGHLASNLGVVELTVALQYLLDTPKDKIVWDTSNQAYAHKLLTGRREQFHTLRQYGGLSGFCKREESAYDTFNAGHAGTGVSAAFGMVEARDQRNEKHKVVGLDAFFAGMPVSRTKGGQAWNQTGFSIAGSYPNPFFVMTWIRTGPFIFSTFSKVGRRCSKLCPSIGPAY